MRCALAGIKPYKSNEWSIDAIEMLQNLSQSKILLEILRKIKINLLFF